jgi:glycosyltransferase involved in cell wall biosynthesis
VTRLLLHAPNVHVGGGRVLLEQLLAVPGLELAFANLDARLPEQAAAGKVVVNRVRPSAPSRLRAEFLLARHCKAGDTVLCFHGMPPLRKLRGRTVVFLQNRNYLGLDPLSLFGWRTRVRLAFERFVCRAFRRNVDEYVVQTPSMERATRAWHGGDPAIRVLPFFDRPAVAARLAAHEHDFIYVADGEAHKNHRALLSAWIELAREGLRPSLALTLGPGFGSLLDEIDVARRRHDLHVRNLGALPRDELLRAYAASRALIFPSLSESFGMPLVEATAAGLPIVASETDVVRDVCDPSQTFDPRSPVSIARAVRRFLGAAQQRQAPRSAAAFLEEIAG